MKRVFHLILACLMASNLFAADYAATESSSSRFAPSENRHIAKRGYHAFVTLDEGITRMDEEFDFAPYVGVTTTHGYQFCHYLFVGAGFGTNLTIDPNHTFVRVPIYAEIRTNAGKRVAQFTAGLRVGMSVTVPEPIDPTEDKYTQFYSQLDLGLRLGFSPKFALHITPYLALSDYKRRNSSYNPDPEYVDEYQIPEFQSIEIVDIGLRVAFEF